MHRRLSALGVACALVAGLACGGGGTGGNGGSGGSGGLGGGGGSGGMGGGSCPAGEGQPTAHTGQDGVLVPSMNKLVLFGGDTQQLLGRTPIYTDELWIYDVGCKVWSHPHPDVAPSARGEYAAALDTQRNRILYVGGRASASSVLNDVWAFDPAGGTFKKLAPTGTGPTPREGHRAVYDSRNDRLLVFGGNTSTFFGVEPQNDLFELKFASSADGVWNRITATGGPSAREDVAMAFHPDLGVVAVFGGCLNTECRLTTPISGHPAPSAGDVYFFDVTTDKWSTPEVISDTNPRLDDKRPRERYWSELMPVTLPGTPSTLQGFVLFGGFDDFAQHWRNDLWALLVNPIKTQATFKALWVGDKTSGIDITAPERRFGHAAAVSGTSVWLAGGSTACGLVDDLWTFDLANPSPGPCPPGAMECWYAVTRPTTGLSCDRRKTGAQICDDVCSDPR